MLDLAYVIFLFMAGYITRSTSPYLKEWVRGLVDLLSRAEKSPNEKICNLIIFLIFLTI
jgi:hypothetical protein